MDNKRKQMEDISFISSAAPSNLGDVDVDSCSSQIQQTSTPIKIKKQRNKMRGKSIINENFFSDLHDNLPTYIDEVFSKWTIMEGLFYEDCQTCFKEIKKPNLITFVVNWLPVLTRCVKKLDSKLLLSNRMEAAWYEFHSTFHNVQFLQEVLDDFQSEFPVLTKTQVTYFVPRFMFRFFKHLLIEAIKTENKI